MNSIFSRVAGALLVPLALCSVNVNAQWSNVGPAGFSDAGISNWQKLRLSNAGQLFVSFNDDNMAHPGGNVMKFDGTNWISVGDTSFTDNLAQHSSFAFGNGDTLYYSYADGNNMSRAAVMMYDGTDWLSLGTGISAGACQNSNIEVGADGTPYLIFNTSGSIATKMYDGTSWIDMGSGTIPGGIQYPAAAFDNAGTLHVAYSTGGQVALSKWDGTAWVAEGTPYLAQMGGSPLSVSLAFDSNDDAYIAYSNPFMGPPALSVVKYDGTTWSNVGTPAFTGFTATAMFPSLAIDGNDVLYLAYQNQQVSGGSANVVKFDGANWVDVGTPNITNGTTAHESLVIDASGNPFLAFFDGNAGSRTSVVTYTLCTPPSGVSVSATDTVVCSGDTVTLTVAGTLNDATDWTWYSGTCGGTTEGTGSTLEIYPGDTTTYYVSGTGGCMISPICTQFTVYSGTVPVPTVTSVDPVVTSSAANGNQWYTGGAPISGATGASYTATADGWYYTVVTIGECSAQSDSVFVTVTSVNSISISKLVNVFPVPFGNTLNVKVNANKGNLAEWDFFITDNVGRQVYAEANVQPANNINLEALPAGIYFLTVRNSEGKQVYKVSKQ